MQALRAETVVVPVESIMGRVVAEVAAELDRTLDDPGGWWSTSRAYYDRKRAEGKKHNAAAICLARRRCDVILTMLRS